MGSDTQKSRTQKFRAEHRSFSHLSAVPVLLALLAAWVPLHAEAAVYITLTDRETGTVYISNTVTVPFP